MDHARRLCFFECEPAIRILILSCRPDLHHAAAHLCGSSEFAAAIAVDDEGLTAVEHLERARKIA